MRMQRQLQRHGQAGGLAFQGDARTTGGGDAEVAGERRAERHAGRGNLVFCLHRAHAEVLVLGELVQDVAGGSDGITAEEHGQLRQLAGSDKAPRQCDVAADVGVLTRRHVGRLDHVRGARTVRWSRRS